MNILLAEVALEVAHHLQDLDNSITRAEWRHSVIKLAQRVIAEADITEDTEDLDEVVVGWFALEEAYS